MFKTLPGLLMLSLCLPAHSESRFTDAERARIVTFWNAPGRYKISVPPNAAKNGPWQVRLTADGSIWLLAYQKAVGAAKAPPTVDATASAPETAAWEDWVKAKVAYDRWLAQTVADSSNAVVRGTQTPVPTAPPVPGPIPADLLAAVGNPPAFASAVTPLQYTITFEDGEAYPYPDNIAMRPRFAYYRFPQGTMVLGTTLRSMPPEELTSVYTAAGFTPSEQRIAGAVSRLEGGFESINTYDTGYVSIGFIQFVTMDDGAHSLSEVLQKEKADHPEEFARDFHQYGMDVSDQGVIVVVDPATGAELTGKPAVMKIIVDKRLVSIFQRAGRHSTAFRVAQVQTAKSHYWPSDDPVKVTIGGNTLTGRVSDVVKSEVGLATLFDRKVNRGNIEPFTSVLTGVMTAHNLNSVAEAAAYEREIIAALKYRVDYLKDPTLSQP
jgi:hypothetical protein